MKFLNRPGLIIFLIILALSSLKINVLHAQEPDVTYPFEDRIKSIAVIPFSTKPGASIYDPVSIVSPNERLLTLALYEALITEVTTAKVLPIRASDNEFIEIKTENPEYYYKKAALEVGKSLGADAVLVGVITEYRERKGSDYGVESPASVAFSVQLYDTESKKLLWESYFSETQQALTDNVFEIKKFFKRGARWIPVDELAKEGAREAALRVNKYLLEN